MATWSSLEADADVMKAGNTAFLTNDVGQVMSDAILITKFKTEAKIKMKRDLIRALHIDQENTDDLDDTVDLNEQELKEALAKLQLHYLFLNYDAGEQSAGRFRASLYLTEYQEYKDRFADLNVRQYDSSYETVGGMKFG